MLCKSCGKEIPLEALYCMHCGASVLSKSEKKKKPSHAPKIRGNGTGSVYRLPNGKWACQKTWYTLGKRKTVRKKGLASRKDAIAALENLTKTKNKTITIAQAYEAVKPSIAKLAIKTVKKYEAAYRYLKDIEMLTLDVFELADLQSIIDDIDGGYYSKRYVKDLLSKVFTYAFVDGKIDRNVVPYIVLPPNDGAKEVAIFNQEEINLFWKLWNSGEVFAGYLLILIYCGLRTGELWNIRTENIDLTERVMYGGIKTTKGKAAPIYIIGKIEPIIKHFMKGNDGTLYSRNATAFYREWQAFKKAHELRAELQPYSARHTCASLLTEAKIPEAVIMDITRHTSYDTTLKYTHIDTKNVLSNMEKALAAV